MKIPCTILALFSLLFTFSLIACGSGGDDDDSGDDDASPTPTDDDDNDDDDDDNDNNDMTPGDDDDDDDDATPPCWDYVATVNQNYTGDTSTLTNNLFGYSCVGWDESGPEAVYELTLDNPGDLQVNLTISTGDQDLFLLTDCYDPSTCLEGADQLLTLDDLVAGTYYLVVDGFSGAAGPYEIQIGFEENDPLVVETVKTGLDILSTGSPNFVIDEEGTIHLTYCTDEHTVAYAENSTGSWVEQTAFTGTHTVRNPSIAVVETAEAVVPHVIYHDFDDAILYHAANAGGAWQSDMLDYAYGYGNSTLAADQNDRLHAAYHYQYVAPPTDKIKYATSDGGAWTTATVDDSGISAYPDLTFSGDAADPDINLAFEQPTSEKDTVSALKFAWHDTAWHSEYVIQLAGESHGSFPALVIDSHDAPHIFSSSYTVGLEYSYKDGGTWYTSLLEAGATNRIEAALGSGGSLHAAYENTDEWSLKYVHDMDGAWEIVPLAIGDVNLQEGKSPSLVIRDGMVHVMAFLRNHATEEYTLKHYMFPEGYDWPLYHPAK